MTLGAFSLVFNEGANSVVRVCLERAGEVTVVSEMVGRSLVFSSGAESLGRRGWKVNLERGKEIDSSASLFPEVREVEAASCSLSRGLKECWSFLSAEKDKLRKVAMRFARREDFSWRGRRSV